ncbi:hypothetical protein JCM10213_000806, partial [Rhodosporidiobolus nylandii]
VVSGKEEKLTLTGVYHVPSSSFNLLSLPRVQKAGFECIFRPDSTFQIKKAGRVYLEGRKSEYSLPRIATGGAEVVAAVPADSQIRLALVQRYHRIYGHPGKNSMRELLKRGVIGGFTTSDIDAFYSSSCPPCRVGKSTKLPYPTSQHRAKKPLELLSADLAGPFPVTSWGGCRHFLVVTDAASGWVEFEPMREKSETPDKFRAILARMKAEFRDVQLPAGRSIQTDNGTEFTSSAFQQILADEGIAHRRSVPYTPQQNGRAERAVRTLKEKITSLLAKANVSRRFWAEYGYYACFLLQNTPFVPNAGETPYHFIHGREHSFFHRRSPVIGQRIWVNVPGAATFEDKAIECVFHGTGAGRGVKAFRVQEANAVGGNQMKWARDVFFDKHDAKDIARGADEPEDELLWTEESDEAEQDEAEKGVEKANPPPAAAAEQVPLPDEDDEDEPAVEFSKKELASKWGAASGSRRRAARTANLILASPSRDDENADDVVLYTSLPSSLETGDDLVLLTRKSTG